jgi:hypothetical protein
MDIQFDPKYLNLGNCLSSTITILNYDESVWKKCHDLDHLIPMNQAKIHMVFWATLVSDKRHDNAIIAFSKYIVSFCTNGLFGRHLKLLAT